MGAPYTHLHNVYNIYTRCDTLSTTLQGNAPILGSSKNDPGKFKSQRIAYSRISFSGYDIKGLKFSLSEWRNRYAS